ncbi:cytochrome P450 [Actinoplanes sp. N902-109]|uniref:cytochrome P450 n=1 Tax=Actinoplanes sp. (strain N902-109) TaxID=649831 RepID=UPI000329360B|nr:cytochrome P450 [Actinoplanes sp. N902-109]AGL17158.1 cytochrome P450 [Actinoplanes sp. N902-109]
MDVDLTDPRFWRRPEPERAAAFARLRRLDAPVFFPERRGPGFHALVRHRDVLAASRLPQVFRSGRGVTTPRPARWARLLLGDSMVNLDDPAHAELRGIVSRAFTPRVIDGVAERLTEAIGAELAAHRPDDFVAAVAAVLPLHVVCDLMGIPAGRRAGIARRVEDASGHTAAVRRLPGSGLADLLRLQHLVADVARERRRRPRGDLISALVAAGLNRRQLGSFFSLLLVAGVETTRNAIAHGLRLLTDNPGQRALLVADPARHAAGFAEEVVRYATPIVQFRRTLAADHVLHGHPMRAGQDVMLFYCSANRDEEVFDRPDEFDLTRSPNPHVGFGGGGPHFCLGAALARQELTVLFRHLLTRFPGIRAVGAATYEPSSFDHRVRRLPFTL